MVSLSERLRGLNRALPASVNSRTRRFWNSALPIAQCSLAAGISWWVALHLFGHPTPFFAPIAAVISLGLSLGQRWRRSVEMILGVSIGIGVGDLIIKVIGSGGWQIGVVVALAMTAAVLVDRGPLVPMQAASSACLVATLLPPGGSGGLYRVVDTLVGGVIGLLIVVIIPTHPVLRARRDAAGVMMTMKHVVTDIAVGLRDGDVDIVERGLERARSTQGSIDAMRSDINGGREISLLSPLYWGSRDRLSRLAATADPIDNSVRNIRVLARRAMSLTEGGGHVSPELVDLIEGLAGSFEVLHDMMLADPGQKPDSADAARVLRSLARKANPAMVVEGGLSETVILAQVRSTIVDLLMVAGLRRASAVATLR
ncbi:FUSC family protein [Williamsia sterculiae]|uniref:Uncharacterized membrane protein YgaE, UPF0421/DUF939 family n=1 Tax=Williamsia sterculiae TaxID=1344003 RepID=A0A1N7CPQ0_9NOCA|nr:FUSC family protein [Williamsia sterculiae]SIR65477.1 Uncharacterized membrane protein YgaE, UPF0421/DUF939 family [Williamsia sterculiae]